MNNATHPYLLLWYSTDAKENVGFKGLGLQVFQLVSLAVESRDVSQADKSIIRVSSFQKLCDG